MWLAVDGNSSKKRRLIFLAVLTAITFAFSYQIASPYMHAIVGAIILGILLHPLFQSLKAKTGCSSNWAAALCVVVLVIAVIGPAILLGSLLQAEVASAYRWLQATPGAQNGWPAAFSGWITGIVNWLGSHTGIDPEAMRAGMLSRIRETEQFFVKGTAVLLGNIGSAIVSLTITLFTLFFVLRSGQSFVRRMAVLLPLRNDEIDRLIGKVAGSIQANVLGVIAVGTVQGTLLAIGFVIFGVPSPVLWGIVTAVCSVIPLGGAALVWVPAAVYLFLSHAILKGVLMLLWGAGVVSLSDNIIRPWILSDRVNMSPLLVLLSLLGGVQVFGFWGIFLGPVILSVAVTSEEWQESEWQRNEPADPAKIETPPQ